MHRSNQALRSEARLAKLKGRASDELTEKKRETAPLIKTLLDDLSSLD